MLGRDLRTAASRAGERVLKFIPRRRGTARRRHQGQLQRPDLEELIVEVD